MMIEYLGKDHRKNPRPPSYQRLEILEKINQLYDFSVNFVRSRVNDINSSLKSKEKDLGKLPNINKLKTLIVDEADLDYWKCAISDK